MKSKQPELNQVKQAAKLGLQSLRLVMISLILLTVGTACSSNKAKESDNGDVIPAASDAGTDAVPQAAAEAPPVPGDAATTAPIPGGLPPDGSAAAPAPAPGVPPVDPASAAGAAGTSASSTGSTGGNGSSGGSDAGAAGGSGGGSGTENYSVKHGDTLMKIAFEVYGDVYKWKDLFEANKDLIKDPNSISAGISLKIDKSSGSASSDKNGERYLIKKGDTLGKISNELYGTQSKWKEIWENNKQLIKNPNRIFAGFYLYYTPSANGPASQADAAPAADGAGAASAAAAAAAPQPGITTPQPGSPSVTGAGDPNAGGLGAGAPPSGAGDPNAGAGGQNPPAPQ